MSEIVWLLSRTAGGEHSLSCRRVEVFLGKAYKSVEFRDELGCTRTVPIPRMPEDSQLFEKVEGWEWVGERPEKNG